jgi:adenylate cyclase
MLHQSEYIQLMGDLSWDKVGQSIVDVFGQLLDLDIVILHLYKLNSGIEQYFFYQKATALNSAINSELLKLTVADHPKSSFSNENQIVVSQYEVNQINFVQNQYQACIQANIVALTSIPLCLQENLAASLTIHHLSLGNRLNQEQLAKLKTLAQQANLMLSQMLAREKLHELAHRATTVNRITATIRSSLDPPVMFAAIAKELGLALNVDGCTLSLWTAKDVYVKCVGLYNPQEPQKIILDSIDGQQATTSSVPITENPILQALLFKKKTIDLSDLEQQKALARYELPWHSRARALMIVPLLVEDEIIGSITLRQSANSRHWTAGEIDLAEIVADQAAIAISQVLAHQQVKELAQKETTINRITATIRSSLEPPVMFTAIAKELGSALNVDGCTLSLWTKSDRFVRCVGLYNPHEPQKIILDAARTSQASEGTADDVSSDGQQATTSSVPIAENPILQALLFAKKTVKSKDLEKQQNLARYELPWHAKARALMIVPLILEDELIGSITLRQSATARDWSSSEIELAEAVASQAAIAVQQAKLYQQLKSEEQKVRELNYYLTESVLKRFLPAAIVNKAANGELSLDLTPEPRRITILFCDLVGFTNLSSLLEVLPLAEILNEYLEAMSKAVFDHHGTVDKFIGDGVMAMFGAPEDLSCPEQARRAISTARTMYFYLEQLNHRWQNKVNSSCSMPILQMRCGIHQGKAVVGMFGGGQRKDYTAIGKVVNIASRLQSVATPNTVLISERTANAINPKLSWGQIRNFQLKGIDDQFKAYRVRFKNPLKNPQPVVSNKQENS